MRMKARAIVLAACLTLAWIWISPGQAHIVLPTEEMGWGEVTQTGSEWLADCAKKLNAIEFSIEEQLSVMDRHDVEEITYFFYKRLRSLIAILHMYELKGQIGTNDLTRDEAVGIAIGVIAEECAMGLIRHGSP